MAMSEVKPSERCGYIWGWGGATLGLVAALGIIVGTKAGSVAAQQHVAQSEGDAAAIAEPAVNQGAAPYSIRVIKQAPDKLKLKGLIATEEDHKAVLGLVKASFPSADVADRLKINDGSQGDIKMGNVSFALKALSYLQTGTAHIDEHGVMLSGGAGSQAGYTEVHHFLMDERPAGVTLREVHITKPATAFSWQAEVKDGRVMLSGAVPSRSSKNELNGFVQKLFSDVEIIDQTYVMAGAPDNWLEAAIYSLKFLSYLETGSIHLADRSIQLNGHASGEAALREIETLADKYPKAFSFKGEISAPTQTNAAGVVRPSSVQTGK